ncbi:MAG: ATP-binding protein, partial [Bacteroidota bacterium]
LLDLGLPDSQGLESLEKLNQYCKSTPITVITGLDDEETGKRAIELGAQSYIEKNNLNSQLIATTIQHSIERYQHLQRAKTSEERLSSFMNAATDGFLLLDKAFNILMINKTANELVSNEYDNLIGKNLNTYLPHLSSNDRYEKYLEVLDTGESIDFEKVQVPELGDKYLTIKAFKAGEGLGLIISDITRQVEAEMKLKAANAARDKISSIISHDLRSPFNSILGFLDVLHFEYEQLSEKEHKKYISVLHNAANNTFDLLENLLTWSRNETNRISYKPEEFNLRNATQKTILHVVMNADRKDIVIKDETPESVYLHADWYMFSIVLRNLLSNAIKFTPKNGRITIGVESILNEKATIFVQDTGVGVGKDKIPGIINPNEVITNRGTSNETGTGLGLMICKEFVNKHNGVLWMDSEPGKGSIMRFTMPIAHKSIHSKG